MDDNRIPKQILFWSTRRGDQRKGKASIKVQGYPKKRPAGNNRLINKKKITKLEKRNKIEFNSIVQ